MTTLSTAVAAAQVQWVDTDESRGLYGTWIPPNDVVRALQQQQQQQSLLGQQHHNNAADNHLVGQVDAAPSTNTTTTTTALYSFTTAANDNADNNDNESEVCWELENVSPWTMTVQWLDEQGQSSEAYNFTLEPYSSAVRFSQPGHLFVLSLRTADGNGNEDDSCTIILGAYRLCMALPSQSPHYLRIQYDAATTMTDDNQEEATFEAAAAALPSSSSLSFLVECLLADPTGYDAMVVAAQALSTTTLNDPKAILMLQQIITNIRHHPTEDQFHTLRVRTNPKLQQYIWSVWAARRILELVGFAINVVVVGKDNEDNDTLMIWQYNPMDWESQTTKLDQALQLLQELDQRTQPGFVHELAARPPWQGPPLIKKKIKTDVSGNPSRRNNRQGTHFLTDEEKWQRAERNRQRRQSGGGGGRCPDPGNAPSSKGKWGR